MAVSQRQRKLTFMVYLALWKTEGLAYAPGIHVANGSIISFHISCIDLLTYQRFSQNDFDFFGISKNYFPAYFDDSIFFVLFDYLNVIQVFWGHYPWIRRPAGTRLTGRIHGPPINLKERFGILIQLVGRKKIGYTFRNPFYIFYQRYGIRKCSLTNIVCKGYFVDGIKGNPDPGITQYLVQLFNRIVDFLIE